MSDPRTRKRTSSNVQRISNSLDNQMAYTRRSSARSYRRYGRRSSSYGRSAYSRSRGQFAAANGQRDCSRQVLKWSQVQTISAKQVSTDAGSGNLATSQQGFSSFNAWSALTNSGFYDLFAQMYDQVKLNAVKVKITLLSAAQNIFSSTNNPVFVCAWDRNGVNSTNPNPDEPFRYVSSYGSAITRPMTVGANFGMQRYLYASTMSEKSQYVPTTVVDILGTGANATDDGANGRAFPFKPSLLLAVYSSASDTSPQTLNFNVEWQFDVTFRGTRNDPNAGI